MKRFLLLVFAAVLLAAPTRPTRAELPETLTVVTYNVENYFDVFDNPYTGDEGAGVKSRAEVQAIANAIRTLDADVVFLQEIENVQVLSAMVVEMLPNAGYEYAIVQPTNSGRGINLGVLSRVPVLSVTSHRWTPLRNPKMPHKTWYWSRDLMEVSLDIGLKKPLTVFNVHLKSNRSGDDDPRSMTRRTTEAMALKSAVRAKLKADPKALVLAVGDFNSDYMVAKDQDGPWPAMAYLREPEPNGKRLLTDVHDGLPRNQRESHPGNAFFPPANFDYILASHAMAQRLVPGSAHVLTDHALTTGSDHRPVVASFKLGRK